MEYAIHVKQLRKDFYVKKKSIAAVKNISFNIKKNEVVGFIGPNGAGKTTTLKCLTGILSKSSGDISVLNYNPEERSEMFLKKIAFVMGNKSQLWWELPPIETFLLNKEIYGISTNVYENTLKRMLGALDVKDIRNIPVRKLSLGERMKCELVASLLHEPKLVFLDEPTIGLDVMSQERLRNFLMEYNRVSGATIILTSHNMEDIGDLCNRVMLMNKGTLIYDGDISKLKKKYMKKKIIHFRLKSEMSKDDLGMRVGKIDRFNGISGVVSVKGDCTKILANLLLCDIDDLDIDEPSLEDVIKEVYK